MEEYFSYIRVSTQRQKKIGTSLLEQRDAIKKYALRHGLEIIKEFQEAETAAKRGRPIFDRMIKELRQNKAQGVIMHKIDRSARNLKDWANLGEMIDEGIEVRFVNEELDMHSRGGRLSADIQAVVAADYIRNLKEEAKKGIYGRLKQGLYPFLTPIGYVKDLKTSTIKIPHPVQARWVTKAFELYSTGKYNLFSLRDKMHELGLRNTVGKKISINALNWLLRNPFYIGIMRVEIDGIMEDYSGKHRPIVSKKLFDKVQEVLDGNNQDKKQMHSFLFSRLITCSCGKRLTGEIQKSHVYYRCHNRKCDFKTVREDRIETAYMEKFKKMSLSDLEMNYFRNLLKESYQMVIEFTEKETNALNLQLSQTKNRLSKIADAYIDGTFDRETYHEKKSILLLAEKDLKEKIENLDKSGQKTLNKIEMFFELVKNLYLSYKSANPARKIDLIKTVTSNCYLQANNLIIEPKTPFSLLENRPVITTSGPSRDALRTLRPLFDKLYTYFATNSDEW